MSGRRSSIVKLQQMLAQGRRNSAAKIINRIRSGSIPGWAGGGQIFPQRKTRFAPGLDDEESKKKLPDVDPEVARQQGNVSMGSVVSALYAKLLVVMGIGFPLAEVISSYIPQAYYDGFYLYLYFMSILFMTWIFAQVIQQRAKKEIHRGVNNLKTRLQNPLSSKTEESEDQGNNDEPIQMSSSEARVESRPSTNEEESEDSDDEEECTDVLTELPRSHSLVSRAHSSPPPDQETTHMFSKSPETLYKFHHQGATSHPVAVIVPQKEKPKRKHSDSESSSDPTALLASRSHFGSFYLRIGAVAFGIGSMIYSGLEFGQYFEMEAGDKCQGQMAALTAAIRMIFTFMQMYFIFLNSRMAVSKVSLAKQFGLMHLIGTNLCVWLNVLIQETKHEIAHFYDPHNRTIALRHGVNQDYLKPLEGLFQANSHGMSDDSFEDVNEDQLSWNFSRKALEPTDVLVKRIRRALKGPHSMYDCGRENIIGSLVDSASPFLFPCTIEYSLICAAVCYVMWRSLAQRRVAAISLKRTITSESIFVPVKGEERSPHQYTVDCAGSNKGFFLGLMFLVITIMSLILNFVFVKHDDHVDAATLVVNITELILYSTSTLAVLVGMCRFRLLRYIRIKNLELDNILLIVAQSGSFVFNMFCIIGGQLTIIEHDGLVLVIPLLCLIQLCLQTLFILDASQRVAATEEQLRKKPGREIVTFLLVSNLAMWLINALEKSRGNSHPYLLHFYGVWAWTIITRISMPLAIFYRFHSTVCLCEIWKKAYKAKRLDR